MDEYAPPFDQFCRLNLSFLIANVGPISRNNSPERLLAKYQLQKTSRHSFGLFKGDSLSNWANMVMNDLAYQLLLAFLRGRFLCFPINLYLKPTTCRNHAAIAVATAAAKTTTYTHGLRPCERCTSFIGGRGGRKRLNINSPGTSKKKLPINRW